VTVELTPPQAQTLLQARQSGSLALALRSLVDSQSDMPEGGDDNTGDHKGTINTVRYGVSSIAAAH
jgi:pilus assembly protein CpaB